MDHSHHEHHHHAHEHKEHTKHQNHDKHAGHSVLMFKNKFWLSLILTIPVVIYSDMVASWLHITPPTFPGSEYIPFVLGSIIFFYGGMVFIQGAWRELKNKLPGMMTLISLAIITAYIYSVATLFFIPGDGFFWELATLITIMLLGHWLEMAAIQKSEGALGALSKLLPDTAEKLVHGHPTSVKVSELQVNDLVLVRPGSNIPADGIITEGASSLNEAALTGESKPISKTAGDTVIAGTTNQDGSLTVKIIKIGENTALAGILRLVNEAQNASSRAQVLADRAAFILTIVAIVAGIITFVAWLFLKDTGFALERAVTVLIIACPHALGLAVPLVVSIATTLSARNGLLVRRRMALEAARKLDVVLFDKTGTLTMGEHGVTDIWTTADYEKSDILQLAASLEQHSEHIVGKGIVQRAKEQKLSLETATDFAALPGLGVKGMLRGKPYIAASHRYIKENRLEIPADIRTAARQAASEGKTEVYVIEDGKVIGALALADMVRPESQTTIAALHKQSIDTAMITGDSTEVAAQVAGQLGIHQYFANVRPEDKVAKVKELQQNGRKVAMVGDGINDAAALIQADIGIAIGAGTDVAIESADIILVKNDPQDVMKVIRLSQASYRKMLQNLWWAAGYNILAIPLAAGVLYSAGIVLSPAVGAILMSISTIVVALNAQLLRRVML